jgi:hypothetical protein
MSALCQKRTFCAATEPALFDHLVGESDRSGNDFDEIASSHCLAQGRDYAE